MKKLATQRIAIIRAGQAGGALACMLIERGIECLVFDDHKKPSLLLGGWPSAVFAQEIIRHKSKKQDFQLKFWITVCFNVLGGGG